MNSELIMQALEVMWKGMLSIFTVIIILTVSYTHLDVYKRQLIS